MTAAAAGLFAQHLPYIYPGRCALPGAAFSPLPAGARLVSTSAGPGRFLPSLLALPSTLIYFAFT